MELRGGRSSWTNLILTSHILLFTFFWPWCFFLFSSVVLFNSPICTNSSAPLDLQCCLQSRIRSWRQSRPDNADPRPLSITSLMLPRQRNKTQGKSNSSKTTKNCLRGTLSRQKFMQSSLSKWKDFSWVFLSVVVFSCQNAAALSFSATYSFLLCKRCNIHLRPVNGNGPHLRSPFFKKILFILIPWVRQTSNVIAAPSFLCLLCSYGAHSHYSLQQIIMLFTIKDNVTQKHQSRLGWWRRARQFPSKDK